MADDSDGWTTVTSKSKQQHNKKLAMYKPKIDPAYEGKELDGYRREALDCAKRMEDSLRKEVSGTNVVCLMFYRDGSDLSFVKEYSGSNYGSKGKFKVVRGISGVKSDKKSFCAEEHGIVAAKGERVFLFSIAFDINGKKRACGGCSKLLETYNIEDLYEHYA